MSLQIKVKNIIKEVAKEYGVSYGEAEKVWMSMFQYTAKSFAEGVKGEIDTFPSVYLYRIGTWTPSPTKINKTTEKFKAKHNGED